MEPWARGLRVIATRGHHPRLRGTVTKVYPGGLKVIVDDFESPVGSGTVFHITRPSPWKFSERLWRPLRSAG